MKRVAVLSDTHVPSRAERIPAFVETLVGVADHTVHAGDFDSRPAYERVEAMAGGDLTAVEGNADPHTLGLPRVAAVEVGGVRFAVTHGTGAAGNWADRVAGVASEAGADVGIGGHTHGLTDERRDGVRLLNPGSATRTSPATRASMMVLSVADGDLSVETVRR